MSKEGRKRMTQSYVKRTLPPDVSEQDFDKALQALRGVVGDQWVASEEADLARYLDPYPVVEEGVFVPSAAVMPDIAEQVQAVLGIAHDFPIPLSPLSTGQNHAFRGHAA